MQSHSDAPDGDRQPDRLRIPGWTADFVAGLAVVTAAAWFVIQALGFEEADHTGVGPATFPVGIAILLGMCGAVLAIRGMLAGAGKALAPPVEIGRPAWVIAGIALVAAFPWLMTAAGYYVTVALWLPAFLLVAGYRKPVGIVLVTLGFLAFAKVAFEMILGVRLP
jgi:hypothetical protein